MSNSRKKWRHKVLITSFYRLIGTAEACYRNFLAIGTKSGSVPDQEICSSSNKKRQAEDFRQAFQVEAGGIEYPHESAGKTALSK